MPAYCKDSCELKNYRFEQQVLDDKKYASDSYKRFDGHCSSFLQRIPPKVDKMLHYSRL